MNIKPVKTEYLLESMGHKLTAILEHKDDVRLITYSFEDRIVTEKEVENGSYWTDDDYIRKVAESYFVEHKGVLQDLFDNHADKIVLKEKTSSFVLDNSGFEIDLTVREVKGVFEVQISSMGGADVLCGKFSADNEAESLEKLRIFLNTMQGINKELTANINEFTNDKVEEYIKWE